MKKTILLAAVAAVVSSFLAIQVYAENTAPTFNLLE